MVALLDFAIVARRGSMESVAVDSRGRLARGKPVASQRQGQVRCRHDRPDGLPSANTSPLTNEAPAGIHRRRLYDEELVTLVRARHPALARKLTLDRSLALEHFVVSVTGVGPAPVDEVLARMGRTRRVKLRVPNFFAAVEIAARSDLIMTLPSSPARAAALRLARQQDAPRHIWRRRAVVTAAMDMSSAIDVGS